MRKHTLFILVAALLSGGCDYINKINPFGESVDTLEVYRLRQDSIRRTEILEWQLAETRRKLAEARRELAEAAAADSVHKTREETDPVNSGGRYHLIAGAFKTAAYARDFNNNLRNLGYDSRILTDENNLHMVIIKSFDSHASALSELRSMRNRGEHDDAWLYIEN